MADVLSPHSSPSLYHHSSATQATQQSPVARSQRKPSLKQQHQHQGSAMTATCDGSNDHVTNNKATAQTIPVEPTGLPPAQLPPPSLIGDQEVEGGVGKLVDSMAKLKTAPTLSTDFTHVGKLSPKDAQPVSVGDSIEDLSSSSTNDIVPSNCCGGGCCMLTDGEMSELEDAFGTSHSVSPVPQPDNAAFKSLRLRLSRLKSRGSLSGVIPMPVQDRHIYCLPKEERKEYTSTCAVHPPNFVKPHPPYDVFSARLHCARQLTKKGAEKQTYHLDLDVTDYEEELEGVDFRVGGAIGVVAPNYEETVEEIFDRLEVPEEDRDIHLLLKTDGGRWPTLWGAEKARELITTRRELLTWTVDVQSCAPTKYILRVLAEYAHDENEKTILLYLCSKQGQAAFCELRSGPHISLLQLLYAFPSSLPPFDVLLCVLPNLMYRFYSLSSDPHFSFTHQSNKRIIEIAVTLHEEDESWRGNGTRRQGVGSGFLIRQAQRLISHQEKLERGELGNMDLDLRIPIFRGLMANPLAREFIADGPMLLIGAGVGIAPFRGFVQRRLQNANCLNKVWVFQGIRDCLVDELYSGEWGVHESKVRRVVESRVASGKYVQEEVKAQADLVWRIISSSDGRIFVCGSTKGMGEGVESALVEVAMLKGMLSEEEAKEFWKQKKESYQLVTETW